MHLGNVKVDSPICSIDSFECLDGLNEGKLTRKLEDILGEVRKRNIEKIGVLLDIDKEMVESRLVFVQTCLKNALLNVGLPSEFLPFDNASSFIDIKIDDDTHFQLACYFTDVDGKGELENVLKAIKTQKSVYADCLDAWKTCIQQNGAKEVSEKELIKLWVDFYIRWDTCNSKDKKQAERKCSMKNLDYVMENKADIFDFQSDILNELKTFLNLFS